MKDPKTQIPNLDMIIFCTHLSEYTKILKKFDKYIGRNTIITDVGSSKEKILKNIKTNIGKKVNWISSLPIAGSEVSGPKFGDENLFLNKWCVLIKDKNTKKNTYKYYQSFGVKSEVKLFL